MAIIDPQGNSISSNELRIKVVHIVPLRFEVGAGEFDTGKEHIPCAHIDFVCRNEDNNDDSPFIRRFIISPDNALQFASMCIEVARSMNE